MTRELIRAPVQRGIRQRIAVLDQGRRMRRALGLGFEELMHASVSPIVGRARARPRDELLSFLFRKR